MDNCQPMRYAIYARYSSDLQRQSSIEDQIRKCDEHGKAQGWVAAKDCIYTDEAISGVSTQRPGLQRMLAAAIAANHPFDVILVDDTSRISRSLSDAVQLFEKLRIAGLRVIAVAQGIDTKSEQADVLVTVHGLVDSLHVKELLSIAPIVAVDDWLNPGFPFFERRRRNVYDQVCTMGSAFVRRDCCLAVAIVAAGGLADCFAT